MTLRLITCCRRSLIALVLLVAIVYAAKPSVSDDFTERRIKAGAKIFRALLAADVDIVQKAGSSGELRLCLLYIDHTGGITIAQLAARARKLKRQRGLGLLMMVMGIGMLLGPIVVFADVVPIIGDILSWSTSKLMIEGFPLAMARLIAGIISAGSVTTSP